MKNRSMLVSLIAGVALALVVQIAWAKGPGDSIVVQGPGLTAPLEITDPEALTEFSPWSDAYMDIGLGRPIPSRAGRVYAVTLVLKPQHTYSFDYVPNPSGGRGFVHVPGLGDERLAPNQFTIIRSDLEGRWLYASIDWDALMRRVLPSSASTVAPETMPESGGTAQNSWLPAILLSAVLSALGAVAYQLPATDYQLPFTLSALFPRRTSTRGSRPERGEWRD